MSTRSNAALLVIALMMVGGCASTNHGTPYIDTSADFTGPTVATGDDATFTVTTLSGGWTLKLDQTIRDRFGVRAFATLTRPAPNSMNTAALEPHPLAIPGADGHPTALYIRMLDFKQSKPASVPYRLAATTTPRP